VEAERAHHRDGMPPCPCCDQPMAYADVPGAEERGEYVCGDRDCDANA
jgi:hypothetical protein